MERPFSPHWINGSSPILYGNSVVFNTNYLSEQIIAVDKQTASVNWTIDDPTLQGSHQTPIICQLPGEDELVVLSSERLSGYSPMTGQKRWHYDLARQRPSHQGSPIHAAGVVYAMGENLVAIRGGGTRDIHGSPNLLWSGSDSSRGTLTTPILFRGHIASTQRSVLSVFDRMTGKRHLSERIFSRGTFFASPVVAGTDVLFVDEKGIGYVLDPNNDWAIVSKNIIKEESPRFNGTPAVLDDCLLIRSDESLYCIGE